jgi:hypothetical protein
MPKKKTTDTPTAWLVGGSVLAGGLLYLASTSNTGEPAGLPTPAKPPQPFSPAPTKTPVIPGATTQQPTNSYLYAFADSLVGTPIYDYVESGKPRAWVSRAADNTYLGIITGKKSGGYFQLRLKLSSGIIYPWVHESKVKTLNSIEREAFMKERGKMPSKELLEEIVKFYKK